MRPQINSRVTNCRRHDPIKPATPPVKQRQAHRDGGVVRHMPGWKRRARSIAVGLIRITDRRLFEERHKFGTRLLQLDHAHALHLFRPVSIDRRFQKIRNLLGNEQRQEQAQNAGARLESAKEKRAEHDNDEQRLPYVDVADRGHEQIERGIRPSLVDEMKYRLIHLLECEAET